MSEEKKKEQPKKPKQPQKKVNIDLPKDLKAVYANVAFITHSPAEMVVDFAQLLPRSTRGTVQSRIIMTPMHAKMLHMALSQNIAKYEQQYGEIRLPQRGSALANNFFRFPQDDQGEDDKDNDKDK